MARCFLGRASGRGGGGRARPWRRDAAGGRHQGAPPLGEQWRPENPYRKHEQAIKVGASAYNQNCARCHGLEAISGGIAPDLRKLDNDCVSLRDSNRKAACVKDVDESYATSVRRGKVRNGAVYMPPFEGILNQEAVWSIKAYLETRRREAG